MFKKKMPNFRCGHSSGCFETRPVTKVIDGRKVVVFEEVDITDPNNQVDLPSRRDFSLENQLNAGIPLKELPTQSLLNPTDPASQEQLANGVLGTIADQLPEVEPQTEE